MPLDGALTHDSPTLLAEQPLTLPTDRKTGSDWDAIYSHLEARLGALRVWRYSWWVHWARLAKFLLPYRYHWVVTANTTTRGNPVNEAIVDSTATLAMRVCASGMLAGLMSPSRPWFKLGVALENFQIDAEAQDWLDDTTERIYAVLSGSNFYSAAAQFFEDIATFGTSVMILYEDYENILQAYVPCAGEYFLAVGGRLTVDTCYREFTYTVTQTVDWFGLENCPQQIRTKWEAGGSSLETEFVICHAIEPNYVISSRGGKAPVRVVPASFPYREVYWLRGAKTNAELSRKGFHERPFMAGRWSATSNDAYGRGPGMDALGDTQQLQQEQRRKGEYIDKMVRPPMGADAEMEQKPSSILPGEVTYTSTVGGKKGFWPLFEINGQGMAPLTKDIESVQERIERCFFVPVFKMFSQREGVQPLNELELTFRQTEQMQQLGPVVELFEGEVASGIQRAIAISWRRGLLKPPPKSLRNVPVAIQYNSMMKQAQRQSEIGGIQQTVGMAAKLSEAAMATHAPGGAQLRDPMRIINLDQMLRVVADRFGFPGKGMFSQDEVDAADKARDQRTQQQAGMQAIPAAVQAAEGASKIDIGGGQNPVAAMLGGQAGTPSPSPGV